MPLYEYRCAGCRRKVTLFYRSFSSVEDDPACPHCGVHGMQRLVSRFWAHHSSPVDEAWQADWSDADDGGDRFAHEPYGDMLENEDDPVEFARQTRAMAAAFGEPLEPELDVALRQIESGADPEDVLGELDSTNAAASDEPLDDSGHAVTES
jgi:putative FmdB family regulatory protein